MRCVLRGFMMSVAVYFCCAIMDSWALLSDASALPVDFHQDIHGLSVNIQNILAKYDPAIPVTEIFDEYEPEPSSSADIVINQYFPPVKINTERDVLPGKTSATILMYTPFTELHECVLFPDHDCWVKITVAIILHNNPDNLLVLSLDKRVKPDSISLEARDDASASWRTFLTPLSEASFNNNGGGYPDPDVTTLDSEGGQKTFWEILMTDWYQCSDMTYLGNGWYELTLATGVKVSIKLSDFIAQYTAYLKELLEEQERYYSLCIAEQHSGSSQSAGRCTISGHELSELYGGLNREPSTAYLVRISRLARGGKVRQAPISKGITQPENRHQYNGYQYKGHHHHHHYHQQQQHKLSCPQYVEQPQARGAFPCKLSGTTASSHTYA